MSRVVALRINFPITSRSCKVMPPGVHARAAIDAGENYDRHLCYSQLARKLPDCDYGARPVGPEELSALLRKKGVVPLPGVRTPKMYAAMLLLSFIEEEGFISRGLVQVTKQTYERLVRHLNAGLSAAEAWGFIDPKCTEIYADHIAAHPPATGAC